MRIFTIKLAGLYKMYAGNYTNNVKNEDIIRCVLEDGLNMVTKPEVIAIHPSANPTFTVKCENEGHMYLSDFSTEDQGAAMSKALMTAMDYPHTDVTIRVNGDIAYLNQSGFSHKPERWEMQSSGWLAFEAKEKYTSERGELLVGLDRRNRKVIQGSWLGDVKGKLTSHGKVFRYNPNSFKKAVEWLNKLEGSE